MTTPTGLPPLSLSSGPAISGGPTSTGASYTGAFTYGKDGWQQSLAKAVPFALVLGVVWWLSRR